MREVPIRNNEMENAGINRTERNMKRGGGAATLVEIRRIKEFLVSACFFLKRG